MDDGYSHDEVLEILGDRAVLATAMLCDAVRLDFAQFMGMHVEGRLRSRPHFLRSLSRMALMELRERLQRELQVLIASSEQPVHSLRARLLAEPMSREDETSALGDALGRLVVEKTRGILVDHRFPDDDTPDLADKPIHPLWADFPLRYVPSPQLLWAWRQVRALDVATEQYKGAGDGKPVITGFEVRYYLPEALPADKLR
jgi:hypothetical protein